MGCGGRVFQSGEAMDRALLHCTLEISVPECRCLDTLVVQDDLLVSPLC